MRTIISLVVISLILLPHPLYAQSIQKHRAIILTDIEADPDDTQSLVRLLLYSNQVDIKGFIATTSCWHRDVVNPESIEKAIHAYGQIHPNLIRHEEGFPDAESLLTLVKSGLPKYGMLGVGEGKDSEGSEWIIKILEEKDDRPLWISVWEGLNTLAQALFKIKSTKSYEEANHPHVPVLGHSEQINVKSGEGFSLDASGSTDPDGDSLSFLWFNYPEARTLEEEVKVDGAENAHGAYIIAPVVEEKETLHFILKITDKGTPPLSRYKRIIVNVKTKIKNLYRDSYL